MKTSLKIALPALAALALAGCGDSGGAGGGTRDAVKAVGSSTVYPFAIKVAELYAANNAGAASPVIESTGTGGGMNLFCNGVGAAHPDIVNASRRMKPGEFDTCVANGVEEITEIQVGLDGIALASAKGGITMNLTPEIVYKALAANPYGKEQTAQNWSDVDPSLPNKPILVYGPPSGSGTRDALQELILEVGCDADPAMEALKESDEEKHGQVCTELRDDGKYVSQGEQDNLIVQKISTNADAVGVFGFSYLEENMDKVQGLPMNGVQPTFANISDFSYLGARPLFIYVKNAHLDAIPGLRGYITEWAQSWNKGGPLSQRGLVANPDDVAKRSAALATTFTPLTKAELEK